MRHNVSWIVPLSHWRPLDGVYRRLPDFAHPLTEWFAIDLHFDTRFRDVPELPVGARLDTWENQDPAVREVFRERARRLMRGDLSVLPAYLPAGYAAWQAV